MQRDDTLQTITLSLPREEADALLSLLLRAPETASLSAERIEQLLFRVLRKLQYDQRNSSPRPSEGGNK
jgi:hypothetical protein